MSCKKCKENPVIQLYDSNISLCKNCYIKYFEKKVWKTISKYDLIGKNDHVIVACSGGKDSTVLLYLINKFASKFKNIKVTALAIDEGIEGYRDKSLKFLKGFCKQNNINLEIVSFKKEFGKPLDEILKSYSGVPCSICGVLRRYLLNKKSKELGATKLATGHNLDDESQSVLMNYFRNNLKLSARLGPITGLIKSDKFTIRIKPLYFITEKETTSYAFLKGFIDKFNECPYDIKSYRAQVRDTLNEFESKYQGTKHSIIISFLELLPLLKEHYKTNIKTMKFCEICDEPSSSNVCKACQYVKEIISSK